MDLGSGTRWKLAGSNEDSAEASAFLSKAFGAAIFLIFLVLLAQFNKFTSVWLVLSCVVMATIGVFLGLLLTGQAFGIVMSGIGVIALAGVVVNNNIVLIDTYDRLREEGWNKMEAVLQTCRERARPVVLTAVSAILGVLPIAFGLGLEIFHQETTINAPSTQWWISLSSAIVFGLSFATVLTLIVTPSMLMVFTRATPEEQARGGWFGRPVPARQDGRGAGGRRRARRAGDRFLRRRPNRLASASRTRCFAHRAGLNAFDTQPRMARRLSLLWGQKVRPRGWPVRGARPISQLSLSRHAACAARQQVAVGERPGDRLHRAGVCGIASDDCFPAAPTTSRCRLEAREMRTSTPARATWRRTGCRRAAPHQAMTPSAQLSPDSPFPSPPSSAGRSSCGPGNGASRRRRACPLAGQRHEGRRPRSGR